MENKYKYSAILLLATVLLIGNVTKVPLIAQLENVTEKLRAYQDEREVKRMQKLLLGPYHDIRSLTTGNIAHAYITFLENARAHQANWSAHDWVLAKTVMQKLDNRKNSMDRMLKVADKSHIRTVQAEFRRMEAKMAVKEQP